MASQRRAQARTTTMVGLAFSVPAVVLGIVTLVAGATLFTALLVPLVLFGGTITWLGTFDWIVSRGAEVVKATH